MSVCRIALTHLSDDIGEQTIFLKDARILSKEAEDQSSHEVIQFFSALRLVPVWILFQ